MSSPQNSGNGHGILNISLRTAAVLLLFTLAFTTLMAITYTATKDPIAASAEAEKLRLIGEVLPPGAYDNDLLKDYADLPATPELGLDQPTHAYRARKGGEPAALVFEAAAPDGYSGRIGLILAVRTSGASNELVVYAAVNSPPASRQPQCAFSTAVGHRAQVDALGRDAGLPSTM